MHFLLFYEKVPDHVVRQAPLAAAHLEYLNKAVRQGMLILGGSLADPVDGSAVILLEADTTADVEALASGDPFVTGGVVCRWKVRPWHTVIGTAIRSSKS